MKKVKRIAALIGVVLIASMYLITLISAFFATEYSNSLFLASVFCTITIPIMIYGFIVVYKLVHKDDKLMPPENEDISDASNKKTK